MRKAILALGMIVLVGGLLAWQGAANPPLTEQTSEAIPEASKQQVLATYGKLPLSFEANQGQTDEQVKFLSRGGGYTLFLTSTEAVLVLRKAEAPPPQHATDAMPMTREPETAESSTPTVLRMKLLGANRDPQVAGLDELPGKSNYFIGNDPKEWRTNVPHYRKVKYQSVYSGIDLVYYGTSQRQLEYDFIVAPGHDPKAIALKFEGADNLEVDAQGDLLVHLEDEEVRFQKPYVYQESSGARQEIAGGYVLNAKNEVTFEVASYDVNRPLIIDPVLSYSTYLGGSGVDSGFAIAADAAGNAYLAGQTSSPNDFPVTPAAFQTTFVGPNWDGFVTKLNADGSALLYSTYLGGNGFDRAEAIAVDDAGNAYVTGRTSSGDFPTANPLQLANNGGSDAFVTKISADGSALVYSTYLGGTGDDAGIPLRTTQGIAVDATGNAYVTGTTVSVDFPTTAGAFQTALGGFWDAFVAKLNADGSGLIYSTYLGGVSGDRAFSIAVDDGGNAYVTGGAGPGFPTASVLQPTSGGSSDAFVTKLNADGSAIVYSTYLGGNDFDLGEGIAVDSAGNAYVTGQTSSGNFPTASALQPTFGGSIDAFVTKLNADGSAIVYSTYLGGNEIDLGTDIAVDASGNTYVTGSTNSPNFPTANPFQGTLGSSLFPGDAFVTKVNADGSGLIFSTYLGGSGQENTCLCGGIATDPAGGTYVTGDTVSVGDFPTANPLQSAFAGGVDAFVAKFTFAVGVSIDIKPGNDPNAINPADSGLTAVAILTTETFDATTVSPTTVQFGSAGASLEHKLGHLKDVDGDGDLDLVLHFRTQESGILCGDTEASLTGETFDGQAIQGSDSFVTVGCS